MPVYMVYPSAHYCAKMAELPENFHDIGSLSRRINVLLRLIDYLTLGHHWELIFMKILDFVLNQRIARKLYELFFNRRGETNVRYVILSMLLLIFMTGNALFGNWIYDFWEHSAVVKELSVHTIHPKHPLLIVDKPHAFFSPYLVVVGIFSRITSLNSIQALAIAGIANLLLFLIGFRLFINCFIEEHQDTISFYSLLFVLFLWPPGAWIWSGFFHSGVLEFVLPYPSTFAGAATFLLIASYHQGILLESAIKSHRTIIGNPIRFMFLALLLAAIILAHPTTAVFSFIGILSISLHHVNSENRVITRGVLLLSFAIFLALLWPYYSLIDLMRANTSEFHSECHVFYTYVYGCAKPLILLSPFALVILTLRARKKYSDGMVLMIFASIAVYAFGYFTKQYGYGRIISYIAILIQINIAVLMSEIEIRIKKGELLYIVPMVLLLYSLIAMNNNKTNLLDKAINGLAGRKSNDYEKYEFIGAFVGQYDVILANSEDSWMIPSFGGKVIASQHPVHWVTDIYDRRNDLNSFFSNEVPLSGKLAVVKKYNAKYLLLRKKELKDLISYYSIGKPVYENDTFILIKCSPIPSACIAPCQ